MAVEEETHSFTDSGLEKCLAIYEARSDPLSVEVSYALNGSDVSFNYESGMSPSQSSSFTKAIRKFDKQLFKSKLIPKDLSQTYASDVLKIDVALTTLCEFQTALLENTKILRYIFETVSCDENPTIESVKVTVTGLPKARYENLMDCSNTLTNDFKDALRNYLSFEKSGKSSEEVAAILLGVLFVLTLFGLVYVSVLNLRRKKIN